MHTLLRLQVTLQMEVAAGDSGRLLLDNEALITIAPANSHMPARATVELSDRRIYSITIEYRHHLSFARVRVLWKGPGIRDATLSPPPPTTTLHPISPRHLYSPRGHISGSPFTTYVHPGAAFADASLVSGTLVTGTLATWSSRSASAASSSASSSSYWLTILTAGGTAEFRVLARDSFGNLANASQVRLLAALNYLSTATASAASSSTTTTLESPAPAENLASRSEGALLLQHPTAFNASASPLAADTSASSLGLYGRYTRAGLVEAEVGMLVRGGLMATYYIGDLYGHHDHRLTRIDFRAPASGGGGAPQVNVSGNITTGWPWASFSSPPPAPAAVTLGVSSSSSSIFSGAPSLAHAVGPSWVPQALCDCSAGTSVLGETTLRGEGACLDANLQHMAVWWRVASWLERSLPARCCALHALDDARAFARCSTAARSSCACTCTSAGH